MAEGNRKLMLKFIAHLAAIDSTKFLYVCLLRVKSSSNSGVVHFVERRDAEKSMNAESSAVATTRSARDGSGEQAGSKQAS